MQPSLTRPVERAALLFHAVMAVWFMASAAMAVRQYATAEGDNVPVGTMLGTGVGLGVMLLAWLAGGVVFLVMRLAGRR